LGSPLDAVEGQVAAAFKGQLKKGTLRRDGGTTVDNFGDEVPGTATNYTFDGTRENIDARYAAQASIPDTDVVLLVILGSLPSGIRPKQGDLIQMPQTTGPWHKVRRILAIDPAGASGRYQSYEVPAP